MRTAAVALAVLGLACSGGSSSNGGGGGSMDPPRVFLTAPESLQIGTAVTVIANVSGCLKVQQIRIQSSVNASLRFVRAVENPAALPVTFTLPPEDFNQDYARLGIAPNLTLVAEAYCDDGRKNSSVPLPVTFFPVATVKAPMQGSSAALPDSFFAEGGVGGAATTFIGCIGTGSGTALARVDANGAVLKTNTQSLPFPCTATSVISDRNDALGTRWLYEPDVGAFSFDQNLNILTTIKGNYTAFGVAHDGDGLIWDRTQTTGASFFRLKAKPAQGENALLWSTVTTGIMATTPITNQANGSVAVVMWQSAIGSYTGKLVVQRFNYATGAFTGSTELDEIAYGFLNTPVIPAVAFSPQGDLVYFAYQGGTQGSNQSGVLACPVNAASRCSGGARRWQTPLFDGVITAIVPYSNGSIISAISAKKTYFFGSANGALLNLGEKAIGATGSLVAHGVQPGTGQDFFLLNGPETGWPTEIVAIDSPQTGEVWRLTIQGGATPLSALTMAIDEGGTTWLRVGPNQVKPLTLPQYRSARGATTP